jgi:predicted murein hydrolase (TIGR00659 family)
LATFAAKIIHAMILQCAIIFGCLALGEILCAVTGIKIPSSIVGMLLLTTFLKLGWIQQRHVAAISNLLLKNLGFFFIPPGVAIMQYYHYIENEWVAIVVATLVSIVVVMWVTGWTYQLSRRAVKHYMRRRGSSGTLLSVSVVPLALLGHVQAIPVLHTLLNNEILLMALTFALYYGCKKLQERTGSLLLNPILLTIAMLIFFLKVFEIEYDSYAKGGHMIDFWLKPAVVALGVPLYQQLEQIRRQLLPILVSQLAGCISGILSVILTAQLFHASREVIISLAPKSVTTPIAMDISAHCGGIPSLTAAVVVCVGIFGAMTGRSILRTVGSPIGRGLSMGTASHAVGTSAALEWGGRYGAYASLGLTVNGILTALLTPYILDWMGI